MVKEITQGERLDNHLFSKIEVYVILITLNPSIGGGNYY